MSKRMLAVVLVAAALTACTPAEPPVARVSIEPGTVEMRYPHFTSITLDWSIERELDEPAGALRVFLHLVDAEGEVVRTFDHDFPRDFSVGEQFSYDVELSESALVPALSDGQYALTAGVYDGAGRRWPLAIEGEEVGPNEYRIATVTAVSSGESPKFFFSPTWLPVEGGADLQVLARRWLEGEGVLRLSDIPAAGVLRVGIGIPKAHGKQELVLEEGADQPVVRLETTCSEYSTEVSGSGSHMVEIPVVQAGEESACDVSFSTNYYLLSRDNMSRRTMALEELSWSASS